MTDEELRQLLATMPAGGAATSAVSPIGVPAMTASPGADGVPVVRPFTATGPAGSTGAARDVPIQYYEGDDWAPANGTPQQITKLQEQMIQAGLIPKGAQFHKGVWDEVTRQAFRSVLTYSNSTGMNASMALTALAASPQSTVTGPELVPDIATAAQEVKTRLRARLGRDATPQEVSNLANVLMGYSHDAFDAQQQASNLTGGTASQVDPGARLEQYIEQQYRPEIDRTAGVVDLSQNQERLMGNIFSLDKAITGG